MFTVEGHLLIQLRHKQLHSYARERAGEGEGEGKVGTVFVRGGGNIADWQYICYWSAVAVGPSN